MPCSGLLVESALTYRGERVTTVKQVISFVLG